jgi:D-serine deaminase-like pyridoxal phosphate-dependent protein
VCASLEVADIFHAAGTAYRAARAMMRAGSARFDMLAVVAAFFDELQAIARNYRFQVKAETAGVLAC